MRQGIQRFLALAIALLGVLGSGAPSDARAPNIVLLLADDLGFSDLAPYGSEIETPNLERLAAEGVRFSSYHTAASCAPTRAMLMTGVDSHRNGVPDMPEALPHGYLDQPRYSGVLANDVVTVATLLRDAGYHTYMAGKWHLGHTPEKLPSSRGFEHTLALAETGADNWEQKTYLPIYDRAHWYADGEETTLPEDFYSSATYIDRVIDFIERDRDDGRPFFAYVAFQAVHIPVQAPPAFTEKYLDTYAAGWTALRKDRRDRAAELGLVPADTDLVTMATTRDWTTLDREERAANRRRMAVYAGMVDAMDHHIGRLIRYLESTGEYENTVFLFLSDNGAEPSNPLEDLSFRLWLRSHGYTLDPDMMGQRGSYFTIGASFASAAASPGAYYKFYAGEGGMRVPLIVSGPGVRRGATSSAFTFVTDIVPTLLDLAGVDDHGGRYRGRTVEPIVGRSLAPVLRGTRERVHPADEAIGYELSGNAALFKGDYKLVLNRPPVGDGVWRLYDIARDPGETRDLRDAMPGRYEEMKADYTGWVDSNGVLPWPDDYDMASEMQRNAMRRRFGDALPWIPVAALGIVLLLGLATRRILRRRGLRRRD